jgi:hypothetical protein
MQQQHFCSNLLPLSTSNATPSYALDFTSSSLASAAVIFKGCLLRGLGRSVGRSVGQEAVTGRRPMTNLFLDAMTDKES